MKRAREELLFHFPHYDHDNDGPASAILSGTLKLHRIYETGGLRLYDLSTDPGEQRDLAAARPDTVRDLEARLEAALKAVDARMPSPNPAYDPSAPVEPRRKPKKPGK
jgi:hypothetical protein